MPFSCDYEVNGLEKLDERELEKILKETASAFKWRVEIKDLPYNSFGNMAAWITLDNIGKIKYKIKSTNFK